MPYFDRVKDTSVSTGTGNFTLSGVPPVGYVAFSSVFAVGDQITYGIVDDSGNWETGFGHLSGATTLVRDQVSESTNANALVNFPAGNKQVICCQIAQEFESCGQSVASNMCLGGQ